MKIIIHLSPSGRVYCKGHIQNVYKGRSSRCHALGSVASWEHWDAGWSPSPVQWVKDLVCCSWGLGHSCGLDLIPGPGTSYAACAALKKGKKTKKQKNTKRGELGKIEASLNNLKITYLIHPMLINPEMMP